MLQTIAQCESRLIKVEGAAQSGKTESLIQRTKCLVEGGCNPSDIMIVATNAFAAQALKARLAKAVGETAAASVQVTTALKACVKVLNTPEAKEKTGRNPRILNKAEYNLFLEDMKTTGEHPRKLRNMLSYFFCEMADFTPREKWRTGNAEDTIYAHAQRVLKLRGAMLAQEAAMVCAQFLQSPEGEGACAQFTHVFCDDFQNLTHAQQMCMGMLTKEQFIVTGNPNQTQDGRGGQAYPESFTNFEVLRRGVEVFHLKGAWGNEKINRMVDGLSSVEAANKAYVAGSTNALDTGAEKLPAEVNIDDIVAVKWNTPEDELNKITKVILQIVNSSENMKEARTCIVVPNRRWASMTKKALIRRGIDASAIGAGTGLGGDPRESKRARAQVAFAKLALLANPKDMVAWRSWCGFDNALTNSDAWDRLMDFAEENNKTLLEALEEISNAGYGAKEPFLRSRVLAKKFRAGQDFISKNTGRSGFGLFKAVGAESIDEFEGVAREMVGSESAAELFEMFSQAITDATWPENPHIMHISSLQNMVGQEYDNVFVLGCIDGFYPKRNAFEIISTDEERKLVLDSARRIFASGIAKAKNLLVISYFAKSNLELAEKTKMQVVRVKSEKGMRIGILRPTCFLREAGDGAPTTLGGQQFTAEFGLN